MEKVKLVQVTPDAEQTMAYIARVSNPKNQENPSFEGLLKYCIKHGHWSVFEQAYMTLEIETSRAIAAQILRHRSFTYQEFSQRYADSSLLADEIPLPKLRRQDTKNRQNSIDDIDDFKKQRFEIAMKRYFEEGMDIYKTMLDAGIAKECARMVLPLATPTRIYMTGHVAPGRIISPLEAQMEPRQNTWILLIKQKQFSVSNSPLWAKFGVVLNKTTSLFIWQLIQKT